MKRKNHWTRRLHDVLAEHARLPFGYGSSDCFMICSDAVRAVTGKKPYPKATGYKTEAGAARKLRSHGFETVEDAWRAKFKEIHPFTTQRGDIAVVETEFGVAGGIWDGRNIFSKSPDGNVFLPLTMAKTAFQVRAR